MTATSSAVDQAVSVPSSALPHVDSNFAATETVADNRNAFADFGKVTHARRPRIFIAGNFPMRPRLESVFEIAPAPERVDGIISFRSTVVDATMLERAGPSLKLVAHYAVGTDSIDLAEAARRGVMVVNTPDISTIDVAQHTLGLTLALRRDIVRGDRVLRRSDPSAFFQGRFEGRSLNGATVGIVGKGRIGSEFGRLVASLGATPLYAGRGELERLVGRVDVLSLHCPLKRDTHHLIGKDVLARLGEHAFLVNVARGAIVDENALVDALHQRLIAGAALDVYEFEPKVSEALLGLDNVVLTPHLGASTLETRAAKARFIVSVLEDALLGNATWEEVA